MEKVDAQATKDQQDHSGRYGFLCQERSSEEASKEGEEMTEQEKYRIAMELVQVAAKLYGTPGWAVAERMNELALELLSKSPE